MLFKLIKSCDKARVRAILVLSKVRRFQVVSVAEYAGLTYLVSREKVREKDRIILTKKISHVY